MGRPPCCDEARVMKGPWTPEEDFKLTQFMQTHGPGKWGTLPKKAGLQRCGKSCRLRWKNYLRPDIKRGRFSFEEEETIIQLHRVLGNKWSAIATQLPGRTDNDVKNHWNTRIRKKLLMNGIDPVTHLPRLDPLHLSSIVRSGSLNLPDIQTLVNSEIVRLATLLASSLNQENKELFLDNNVYPMNQNSCEQITNVTSTPLLHTNQLWNQASHMQENNGQCFSDNLVNLNGQTSQETLIPRYLMHNSIKIQNSNEQITSQVSQNSNFQQNSENNFNRDFIFPPPISSSTPLDFSSMLNNGSTIGNEIESYSGKHF